MKTAADLTRDELERFVTACQEAMYSAAWTQSPPHRVLSWDPDREVNGGDLVDVVGGLMADFGLIPPPREDDEEGE